MLTDLITSATAQSTVTMLPRMCLLGAKATGKTHFAFQLAREYVESGNTVLVITRREKLSSFPLPFSQDTESDSYWRHLTLGAMDMMYPASHIELMQMMASLQCLKRRPSLVIIEDLSDIVDPLRLMSRTDYAFLEITASVLAYISDSVQSINSTLVITDSVEERQYLHNISRTCHFYLRKYKLYFLFQSYPHSFYTWSQI
jgi:DNA polymerase III delta prime subunit